MSKQKLYNRVNRKELKERLMRDERPRITLSFYRYARIEDPQQFRDQLFIRYNELEVLGRIYVAHEGINAQLSVPEARFDAFKQVVADMPETAGVRLNIAVEKDGKSFFALIIKVRPKIVADGIEDPDFDPTNRGQHLDAESWNRLCDDPNTIVVDMRNHYESEVGKFRNAIAPDVATFREELPYVAELLAEHKDKNILMYCTGGIRCEKASAYMRYRGFKNVFQLEGGIIEYARQIKARNLPNYFQGKNFVFDERLGERVGEEIIAQCHQCGAPCDDHTNCANDFCHILFIQCAACRPKYEGCCSTNCRDFMRLPETVRKAEGPLRKFNGSVFSKGEYRAFRKPKLRERQAVESDTEMAGP